MSRLLFRKVTSFNHHQTQKGGILSTPIQKVSKFIFLKNSPGFGFGSTLIRSSSDSSSSSSSPEESSDFWTIPTFVKREGESIETIKARLLYQSRKRGMLENDLLLSTFAAKHLNSLSETDLRDYDRLINCPSNDWDIYYWATGVKPIPLEFDTDVMRLFVKHVQNNNKESRFRQPNLY